MNGLEPILVVFEHQKEKESLWSRIKENPKKSKIVVTQFDSSKKILSREKKGETKLEANSACPVDTTKKKTDIVKGNS